MSVGQLVTGLKVVMISKIIGRFSKSLLCYQQDETVHHDLWEGSTPMRQVGCEVALAPAASPAWIIDSTSSKLMGRFQVSGLSEDEDEW